MKTIRLTDHFTLEEFQRSSVAQAHGIDNTVPAQLTVSYTMHFLRLPSRLGCPKRGGRLPSPNLGT